MPDQDGASFGHMHGSFNPRHSDSGKPEFEFPKGFGPAKFKALRGKLGTAVDPTIEELQAAGFTFDEACAVTAHLLLDLAWIAAGTGAIHAGRAPRPLRFVEAAIATTSHVCPVAIQILAPEGERKDG